MKLHDFDKHIPNLIYLRGKEYYADDLIEDVEHKFPDSWSAQIEGTNLYQVEIELNGDDIVSWNCDCPYDYGDICKHVVTFLLYIRDNRKEHPLTMEVSPSTPQQNQIAELLKYVETKELIAFLSQYAGEHNDFYQVLESRFHPQKNTGFLKNYAKDIQRCFKVRGSSYDGYRYSSEAEDIAKNLYPFIEKVKFLIGQHCLEEAAAISLQIIKDIGDDYEEYEDDDGSLGNVCQEASEILTGIIENDASKELLDLLMKEISLLIKNHTYDNYDLANIDRLLCMVSLKASNVDGGVRIIDEVLKVEPDSFRTPSLVISKIELLESAGQHEQTESVISHYLYLPEIREIRLKKQIENNLYEEALSLIDGGIDIAQKQNHSGTVADWKDQKLSVYQLMGNNEKVIELAEDLFIIGRDSMKYYHALKNVIPSEQWASFLDDFLKKTEKQSPWRSSSTFAQIYIEEEYWDRLMSFVEKHIRLGKYTSLESYEAYLQSQYPERMLEFYRSQILDYAEKNMGRDHYQYIASVLKKMKTYSGGVEIVNSIVSHFKNIYFKRRAMMEELSGC
ncbi:hypothetical protein EZS27_030848 [termite gut metagenome]|uniref:SWIM-type domain-containing protein n=1 Tax=termite gut metagenome TaxID=433724 RepID=A0A5J4QBU8_9ZZZZ